MAPRLEGGARTVPVAVTSSMSVTRERTPRWFDRRGMVMVTVRVWASMKCALRNSKMGQGETRQGETRQGEMRQGGMRQGEVG